MMKHTDAYVVYKYKLSDDNKVSVDIDGFRMSSRIRAIKHAQDVYFTADAVGLDLYEVLHGQQDDIRESAKRRVIRWGYTPEVFKDGASLVNDEGVFLTVAASLRLR